MTEGELNRAVARATGESISTVQRLGFLLASPSGLPLDPDDESLGPHVIDWDAREARHRRSRKEGRRDSR